MKTIGTVINTVVVVSGMLAVLLPVRLLDIQWRKMRNQDT